MTATTVIIAPYEEDVLTSAVDMLLDDHNSSHNSLKEHDYSLKSPVTLSDELISLEVQTVRDFQEHRETRKFAKCEACRRSRTKVMLPNSILRLTSSKNDGRTCDFCGAVMAAAANPLSDANCATEGACPKTKKDAKAKKEKPRSYVFCGECGKVVLRESLTKHIQDVHEKSNKLECQKCHKILSGPFSLKEHITAVHNKVMRHKCPHCSKAFSHFSNMNRHVRLIHQKQVITNKYVNCSVCQKCVQATSLKKHMKAIHEKAKEHVCSFCEKGFSQSYTLKEHIASKHTKKYEHKCRDCDRQFAHKTNFTRHMKIVHRKMSDKELLESNSTTL